ncbi:MAG: peptidoglycan DD-metalloendopeptidase family protein [Anaerolineae bacterium]|nr:peptidoglycan DD-metalloendopeptidase family protein [Anaerolineae bacterium]
MMSCRRIRHLLAFRRELTGREEQATAQHLAACPACRAIAREYELMDRRLDRLPAPVSALAIPPAMRRSHVPPQRRQEQRGPAVAPRSASQALLLLALLAVVVVAASVWSTNPEAPASKFVAEGPVASQAGRVAAEAAPSTATTPLPAEAARYWGYAVREGETLRFISRQVGVPVEALEAANGSMDLRSLKVGEVLWIPLRVEDTALKPVAGGEAITYTVQAGDTLWSIAKAFGLEPESVLWSNPHLEGVPDMIAVGDVLAIPPVDGFWYTVQEGDTLEGLAETYLTTVEEIVSFAPNELHQSSPLRPGQQIMIPNGRQSATPWHAYYPVPEFHPPASAPKGDGAFAWPVEGLLVQPYWSGHLAIDVANSTGTPVYAAEDGYVTLSGRDTWGFGNQVVIDHGNAYLTRYAQLNTILVRAGESVHQEQQIGTVGSTGRATGPHLHFEIIQNGARVDPMGLLP